MSNEKLIMKVKELIKELQKLDKEMSAKGVLNNGGIS